MAGLFSPRSTARCNSRSASSALPSWCSDTSVASDRERLPFSSGPSLDPFTGFWPVGLPAPGLPTTARRGEDPVSTGFRLTELIERPSFLFSLPKTSPTIPAPASPVLLRFLGHQDGA